MGKGWGDPSCSGMAAKGWAGKAPTGALMRFTDARNDKPPVTGVDAAGEMALRFRCELSVEGSLKDCSSSVNHPTTPNCSGTLVGETTRRVTLNLHRGSQPVGARRIVGKHKWQSEQSGEK